MLSLCRSSFLLLVMFPLIWEEQSTETQNLVVRSWSKGPSRFKKRKEKQHHMCCVLYYRVLYSGQSNRIFISSPGCPEASMKKKHRWCSWYSTTQTSLDPFFKRIDRMESSKKQEPIPSMSGLSKTGSLPSISYCWRSFSSAVSHLLSLLHQ